VLTLLLAVTCRCGRFAANRSIYFKLQFGLTARSEKYLQQIKDYRVAPLDASFLVWSRVINLYRQAINFAHWDWMLGVLIMSPILLSISFWLEIVLSPKPTPAEKADCHDYLFSDGLGSV
jgi:hypothetical protein